MRSDLGTDSRMLARMVSMAFEAVAASAALPPYCSTFSLRGPTPSSKGGAQDQHSYINPSLVE